jgi:hypothetical protein
MLGCWVRFTSSTTQAFTSLIPCQIATSSLYSAVNSSHAFVGSNCKMLPISFGPLSYSSSVAFDLIIVLFATLKLAINPSEHTHIRGLTYLCCIFYFATTLLTNVAVLAIQAIGPAHDPIKPTATPFSTLMMITMGSRVFLNLHSFDAGQGQILPFASHFSQRGPASPSSFGGRPSMDDTRQADPHTPFLSSQPGGSGLISPWHRPPPGEQNKRKDLNLQKEPDKSGWI